MNSLEILDKVNNLRKLRGISVYRLTKEAGVSHNTLNAWRKRQTMPSFGVLEALCDVLGVEVGIILLNQKIPYNDISAETEKMLKLWELLNFGQKKAFTNLLIEFIKNDKKPFD